MPIGLARQAEVDPGVLGRRARLRRRNRRDHRRDAHGLDRTGYVAIDAVTSGRSRGVSRRRRPHVADRPRSSADLARRRPRPSAPAWRSRPAAAAGAVPVRTAIASAVTAVAVIAGVLTFGANSVAARHAPGPAGLDVGRRRRQPALRDVAQTAIPTLTRNTPTSARCPRSAATTRSPEDQRAAAPDLRHRLGARAAHMVPVQRRTPAPRHRRDRARPEDAARRSTSRSATTCASRPAERPARCSSPAASSSRRSWRTNQIALGQAAVVTGAAPEGAQPRGGRQRVPRALPPRNVDRPPSGAGCRPTSRARCSARHRPADIENLQRVNRLPALLAGLFALIALLIVGNMLVTSVRRRRREVAVLRSIGFVRRQVSAIVIWQATMVALVAIVVGVPVGAAAGRATWTLVTDRLGLEPNALFPARPAARRRDRDTRRGQRHRDRARPVR